MRDRFDEKAAQLWCLPQHANKEIDSDFAHSIAEAIRTAYLDGKKEQQENSQIRIQTLKNALASIETIRSEGYCGTYVASLQNRLDKIIDHAKEASKL